MITLRGIGLLIFAIFTFYLAESTRVGWILLFDAVLWGTIVISAIMPWFATGKLQVRRRVIGWEGQRDDPGPMEGDAVEFELNLRNRGFLPAMFVTVEYNYGGEPVDTEKQRLFIAWLGRNKSMSGTTKVRFQRRGLHQMEPIKVETTLPFGMFRRSRRFGEPSKLVVLPKAYPVGRLDMLGSAGTAAFRPLPARIGEQISGSRNYYPGDPMRHIHWRNTARTAHPQIKEFEEARERSLVIAFDAGRAQQEGDLPKSEENLEHAVKIAASVGNFLGRSGIAVRVMAGRLDVETSDRRHLLEELALLERVSETSLASLLRNVDPWSSVLAIVEDTDAEGVETLAHLGWNPRQVIAVVLQTYESGSGPGIASKRLGEAGVEVVQCRQGDVASALAALGGPARPGDRRDGIDVLTV